MSYDAWKTTEPVRRDGISCCPHGLPYPEDEPKEDHCAACEVQAHCLVCGATDQGVAYTANNGRDVCVECADEYGRDHLDYTPGGSE